VPKPQLFQVKIEHFFQEQFAALIIWKYPTSWRVIVKRKRKRVRYGAKFIYPNFTHGRPIVWCPNYANGLIVNIRHVEPSSKSPNSLRRL
jgi:hypothetical protein